MESQSDRRPDLDALRIFACYLLFLFHVGMIFNPSPFFHVRNAESSVVFFIVCGFIGIWHMPLLFLLAGWSAAASLRSRGVGLFLRERFNKLVVPLVAGCVLLMPVIKFIELRSGQDLNHRGYFVTPELQEQLRSVIPVELPQAKVFDESFLEFLPGFFTQLDRFTWSHLWFVAYLLVFTLVLLPVLLWWVRRGPGPAAIARAWLYLPILPLVVIQLTLRERFPGPYNLYSDWASVSYFITFLISGFAMSVVPAFEALVRSEWRRALALAVAATGVLLAQVLGAFQSVPVVLAVAAVACWCYVVALLGFAHERITRSGPRLRYLAESAFPIYVLHQPVVVVLGAAVVALPLGIPAKFVLLLAGSVAVTLAIYHFAVRPFGLPRRALGMKKLHRDGEPGATASVPIVASSRVWRGAAPLLLLAALLRSVSAEGSEPVGLWWAEGGAAQVEIVRCADALCGRVTWLRSPFDEHGCELRDSENPNPTQRARGVLGIDLLRNLRASPGQPGEWGGEIYDPTSGRTYDAVIQMEGPDRLSVRGYLAIRLLGRTTTWLRVGAQDQCREDV